MTSQPCLTLLSVAVLTSLASCSSGNSSGFAGGGNSNPVSIPVPTISSISPSNATAGSADLTITVNGSGFVSTSTVNWNGSSRMTTEMSATAVTATITAADIAAVGAAQIAVDNPAPGGGTSNPVGFAILGSAPAATPGYLYAANGLDGTVSAFSIDPNTGGLTSVAGSPFQAGTGSALTSTTTEPNSVTTDPSDKFLYVANAYSNDISAFTINPSTGALTPVPGSPFTTGSLLQPIALSVDSTGKFLYVADFGGDSTVPAGFNDISEYSIDATTGALTQISEASCVGPSDSGAADGIVTDPIAGFLLVSNNSSYGDVCTFSISPQGILQPVTGSPFSLAPSGMASLPDPRAVAVDPFGKFVYTANYSGLFPGVSAFSIAPGVGALNPVPGSPFTTGPNTSYSNSLGVDPLGRFLYAVDFGSADISSFSINTSTGTLSLLAGFPISAQVAAPTSLVVDPSGKFLYLANSAGMPPNGPGYTISVYAIDATTGVLTPVTGSPFVAGENPRAMTVTRRVQ
jgi:6-phosphogluconolactonase